MVSFGFLLFLVSIIACDGGRAGFQKGYNYALRSPLRNNFPGLGPLAEKFFSQWKKNSQVTSEFPLGIIKYYVNETSYDKAIVQRLRGAMDTIEADSCIRFHEQSGRPKNNEGRPWVHFVNPWNKRPCVHEPVFTDDDGETIMVLGLDCLKRDEIIHTVLHAIGFKDEVTHPQRDQYVQIQWENIQPDYKQLFIASAEAAEGLVEFDPISVMMFHDRAFSFNGRATITPLLPGLIINPSKELSPLDKMKLQILFSHQCNKRDVGKLFDTCKKLIHQRAGIDDVLSPNVGTYDDKVLDDEAAKVDDIDGAASDAHTNADLVDSHDVVAADPDGTVNSDTNAAEPGTIVNGDNDAATSDIIGGYTEAAGINGAGSSDVVAADPDEENTGSVDKDRCRCQFFGFGVNNNEYNCTSNIQYWLFTRSNPTSAQFLIKDDNNSVLRSALNSSQITVILCHGWRSDGNSTASQNLKDAFLEAGDFNVIVLDWRSYSTKNYFIAKCGVPIVGRFVGQFIKWLTELNVSYDRIHLVGFSLGGHVAGNAGKEVGGQIKRITALDPAGPLWSESDKNRLAPTDGRYVEVIHTNALMYGYWRPCGQSDFYVNGGFWQPGCFFNRCSHERAWKYMESTLRSNELLAYRCNSVFQAALMKCTGDETPMGNWDLNKNVSGIFRVSTSRHYPYIPT